MTSPSDPEQDQTQEQTDSEEEQEQSSEVEAPKRRRRTARATAKSSASATTKPHPRLLDMYRNEITSTMMTEFNYGNTMRVPRIQKIVLNIGLGEALTNGRAMEAATRDLTVISGQKPVSTRARKSIANFKLREGNPIGTTVTLRGDRMYHFLDRLILSLIHI